MWLVWVVCVCVRVKVLSLPLCAPGTYLNVDTTLCTHCPVGHYMPYANHTETECWPCPLGTAVSTVGALSCHPCTAGTYADGRGLSHCLDCAPGTVQPGVSSAGCVACEAGTSQAASGGVHCETCPPGHYAHVSASLCHLCPFGTYQNASGASQCVACGPHWWTATEGSVSVESCVECDPTELCYELTPTYPDAQPSDPDPSPPPAEGANGTNGTTGTDGTTDGVNDNRADPAVVGLGVVFFGILLCLFVHHHRRQQRREGGSFVELSEEADLVMRELSEEDGVFEIGEDSCESPLPVKTSPRLEEVREEEAEEMMDISLTDEEEEDLGLAVSPAASPRTPKHRKVSPSHSAEAESDNHDLSAIVPDSPTAEDKPIES